MHLGYLVNEFNIDLSYFLNCSVEYPGYLSGGAVTFTPFVARISSSLASMALLVPLRPWTTYDDHTKYC